MKSLKRSQTFKELLSKEYGERASRKKSYPLKAFAQELKVNASSLHNIMKGKRNAGANFIRKVGLRIGLNEEQVEELLELE